MTEKEVPTKQPKKSHLTDAERHERFVETAKASGADESPEAFDRAFASVVSAPKLKN